MKSFFLVHIGISNQVQKINCCGFRYLNMSYNLVRHLPRYGFRGLNTLETIDLSYNDIREVDERAFEDMRWVTTLKVREGRGSTNFCQM